VPSLILAVPDIPYTSTMKKVELAVKRVIMGEEVVNVNTIVNAECLEHFKDALKNANRLASSL